MSTNEPIFPQPDVLNTKEYGKYVLTNLAARRARQIKDGAPPLVRIDSAHPLSIALAEIAAGKIKPVLGGVEPTIEDAEDLAALQDMDGEDLLLPAFDEGDDSSGDEDMASFDDLDFDAVEEEKTEEPAAEAADLSSLADGEDEEKSSESSGTISLDDLAEEEEKAAGSDEDEN